MVVRKIEDEGRHRAAAGAAAHHVDLEERLK
jgi:hypothetical protein